MPKTSGQMAILARIQGLIDARDQGNIEKFLGNVGTVCGEVRYHQNSATVLAALTPVVASMYPLVPVDRLGLTIWTYASISVDRDVLMQKCIVPFIERIDQQTLTSLTLAMHGMHLAGCWLSSISETQRTALLQRVEHVCSALTAGDVSMLTKSLIKVRAVWPTLPDSLTAALWEAIVRNVDSMEYDVSGLLLCQLGRLGVKANTMSEQQVQFTHRLAMSSLTRSKLLDQHISTVRSIPLFLAAVCADPCCRTCWSSQGWA